MRTQLPLLAVSALVAGGCQDATAPKTNPGRLSLKGDAVVLAVIDPQFTEHERFLIKGHRLKGSRLKGLRPTWGVCAYDRRILVAKGQHFTERVMEFDPVSCRFIVARGDHAPPEAVDGRKVSQLGSVTSSTLSTSARFSLAVAGSSYSWQRLYHEDVLQIDVTSSKITFDWTYDGTRASATGSEHIMEWFSDSGWSLIGDTHNMSPQYQCQSITTAQATASFLNQGFCFPGSTTEAWYDVNKIEGMPDGSAWMSNRGYASGDCSDGLAYHYEYGLT